jgi:hypothetical protein
MDHKIIPAAERHGPFSWEVANAAARNAITLSVSTRGKILLQLDNNTAWIATAGDTWAPLGGGAGIASTSLQQLTALGAGSGYATAFRVLFQDGTGFVICFGAYNIGWGTGGVVVAFNLPADWGPSVGSLRMNPIFTSDKGTTAPLDPSFDIWVEATQSDTIRVLNATGGGGLSFSGTWPLITA